MSPMKPPAKRSQARLSRARAPRVAVARADFNARSGPKGAVDPRNKLNALTGEQWLYRSKSVLQTAYPSAYGHHLRKRHGANKPPQLMRDLIEFFSKPGECVLDPFAGVGGTLLGAALCGRRAVGIEINPEWARVYAQVCAEQAIAPQTMIVGDCLAALDALPAGSADLVATDPPYNLQFERTMCTGVYDRQNRKTDYDRFSDHPDDFSNSATYLDFLDRIERMFAGVLHALRAGGYVVVILRNAYQDGEYIMTQADVAARARRPVRREGKRDFRLYLKGEIIWHQSGSRLRPYGYPYAFVPNIAHQTILVLRKEPIRAAARAPRPAREARP
jgi:DNA modification methylase